MNEEPEIRIGEIEVFKTSGPPTPDDPIDEDEAQDLDFYYRLEPPYDGVEWFPAGWFWQVRKPGVDPDSGPVGPFETPGEAIADAIATLHEEGEINRFFSDMERSAGQ